MTPVLRAALLGAATGGRTFTGLAMLALATPHDARMQPDRTLQRGLVKGVIAAMAAQELVIDKRPKTPSRLEPAGFGSRIVVAAASGAIVDRREASADEERTSRTSTATAAVVAAGAAALACWLGAKARGRLADWVGDDLAGALAEDLLALALGWAGAQPRVV